MGLRPQEPFQRVYSAPEPPAPARRPKVLALLVAVVSFVLAAVAVFWLAPGGGQERPTAARPTPSAEPTPPPATSAEPSASPEPTTPSPSGSPSPTRALAVTALPPPCKTVSQATLRALIPKAKQVAGANRGLTSCTSTAGDGSYRWLLVEATLYPPGDSEAPVDQARGFYASRWNQAHQPSMTETLTLERRSGLGDEAYHWFKVDKGQPTVTGEVMVRDRNVVIRVGYSETVPARGQAAGRRQSCLAKAARVAREVLAGFR
ncbi:hypothetical protein [Actinomadura hibisca]|uniref:hypothetical protein n=1 Tax=Actinomadura hibisca TaxID=68565 RepID=UPI00082D29AB|nr:hypothetical protein [Actinomadura hibisca]